MMKFVGYRLKRLYVETLGAFTVYHDRERKHTIKFRSKERELLAFLLDMGDKGHKRTDTNRYLVGLRIQKYKEFDCGKSEPYKKRPQIRRHNRVSRLPGNRYFIHRDQIECDFELFEKAYKKFRLKKTKEYAKRSYPYTKASICQILKRSGLLRKKLNTAKFTMRQKGFCPDITDLNGINNDIVFVKERISMVKSAHPCTFWFHIKGIINNKATFL